MVKKLIDSKVSFLGYFDLRNMHINGRKEKITRIVFDIHPAIKPDRQKLNTNHFNLFHVFWIKSWMFELIQSKINLNSDICFQKNLISMTLFSPMYWHKVTQNKQESRSIFLCFMVYHKPLRFDLIWLFDAWVAFHKKIGMNKGCVLALGFSGRT